MSGAAHVARRSKLTAFPVGVVGTIRAAGERGTGLTRNRPDGRARFIPDSSPIHRDLLSSGPEAAGGVASVSGARSGDPR